MIETDIVVFLMVSGIALPVLLLFPGLELLEILGDEKELRRKQGAHSAIERKPSPKKEHFALEMVRPDLEVQKKYRSDLELLDARKELPPVKKQSVSLEAEEQVKAKLANLASLGGFFPAGFEVPLGGPAPEVTYSDPRERYLTSEEILLIDRFQASKSKFTKEDQFSGEKNVERLVEAGKLALEAQGFTDENKKKAERLSGENRAMLAGRIEGLLARLRDAEEDKVVRSLRTQNRFLSTDENTEAPTPA